MVGGGLAGRRKSSHSNPDGNCVEVVVTSQAVDEGVRITTVVGQRENLLSRAR